MPYRDPKILNSIEELPAEFKERKISTVMLVTDFQLRTLTRNLEELLPQNGIKCIVYDKTRPNPTVSNVEEALQIYKENNCKGLIAFGGGSSMDCAKAVGARVACPRKPLSKMKGILKIRRKIPFLAAIPTTAGTGSEVTVTVVITDEKTNYKYPMSDFPLIPKVAVLDPKVTFTLPKSLTASTGVDALTHAVEGRNMLMASHLAGGAFSRSYVGYVHAVAHSLGGAYNIPHGLANSVLLPVVLKRYGPKVYKKLKQLAVAAGLADKNDSAELAAKNFIRQIEELNARELEQFYYAVMGKNEADKKSDKNN